MKLSLPVHDFSLQATLECGQAFRWQLRGDGWYYGYIGPFAVKVRQEDQALLAATADPRLTPALLRQYFSLDIDLDGILRAIDSDAQIHEAIERCRGLRILRQDPWETLASFILSSFNNIKRIQGMIERLAQAYGEPAAWNGLAGSTFPTAEAIAAAPERRLRALGLGFRAAYLRDTAKFIAAGRLPLDSLKRADYPAVKAALMHCDGVGEKVADCVALFGLEKHEAFPVDVWVGRAMRYYFGKERMTPRRIHDFARSHFGPYAGWAQQYLFHYVRTRRMPAAVGQQPAAGVSP